MHEILGHANFATTLKLYGGVTVAALNNVSAKIGEAFRETPDKRQTNR